MLAVKLNNIILYGRSLNRFGYFPSITLGGAILKALFDEGVEIDTNNFRVSGFLGLAKEGKNLDDVILDVGILSYYLQDKRLRDYKKSLKKWKCLYKDFKKVLKYVFEDKENLIKEMSDKGDPPFNINSSPFKTVVLPKKSRTSSGLYNSLSLNIRSAMLLVDGISKKHLSISLSYLEDLGLGADKSTSGVVNIDTDNGEYTIREVEIEEGKNSLLLSDTIPLDGEKFVGKVYLYNSYLKDKDHKRYSFEFVRAFSLGIGETRGKNLELNEKIFPGKPITLSLGDINV